MKSSFTSDVQVFRELDTMYAATGGVPVYSRETIIRLLESKGWVVEPLAAVADSSDVGERHDTAKEVAVSCQRSHEEGPSLPVVKPTHIFFESSSEDATESVVQDKDVQQVNPSDITHYFC